MEEEARKSLEEEMHRKAVEPVAEGGGDTSGTVAVVAVAPKLERPSLRPLVEDTPEQV